MTDRTDDQHAADTDSESENDVTKNAPTRDDVAEKPGSDSVSHEHADALADEWGEDSFPNSDPPAHY
ncbi:hypothetical protein ACFWHR_14705 [Leucobacter sp. NPDC058333]|uniref:hypothetical protein n=1 Tax=Leucobacter sp. NPDC058333 TaxID=3346450 RepID=UPI00365FFE86